MFSSVIDIYLLSQNKQKNDEKQTEKSSKAIQSTLARKEFTIYIRPDCKISMEKIKILIVGDEELIALEIATRLVHLGYEECKHVSITSDAIQEVERYKPDIIIMDISIRGEVDGIEMAKIISLAQRFPIIYITAFSDSEVVNHAKASLPYGYLTKPISEKELRITLEQVTQRIRVERKLELTRKRLRRAERKYHLIAENSSDLIFVYNLKPEPHYEYISPSWLQLTGYTPEEGYGNPNIYRECLASPDVAERFTNYLFAVPPPREPLVEQWRRKDGALIWVEQVVTRSFGNDGNVVSFQCTVREITQRVRAEERLRQSEERFRSLYSNSTIGLYRTTPGGKILMANPAILKVLGYDSINELKNRFLAKYVYLDPSRRDEFIRLLEEQDEVTGFESVWLRKDGTAVSVREGARAVRDPKGSIMYIDGTVEDITELKRAGAIRRENEEMQDHFFSQATAGFFFMMLDEPVFWNSSVDKEMVIDYVLENHRITKVNQAMLNQYRANPKDFIGLTPKDLLAHDTEYVRKVWNELFDNGKLHIETREKRSDGTEMHVLGDYVCLYDQEGRITGNFGVQVDITEQKQAIQALSESQERYRRIAESITDYLYSVKVENGIATQTFHNEACIAITGYTPQELNADSNLWIKMVFPDDRRMVMEQFQRFIAGGSTPTITHRLVRKDGQLLWISNTLIPKYNESGALESYDGVVKDITEKMRLENELLRVAIDVEDRERTRFSHEIHDGLGPLLATIKLYFQWLSETKNLEKAKVLTEKGLLNIDKAIQTAKEISCGLSPLFLEREGFSNSIRIFVDDLDLVTDVKISYSSSIEVRFNRLLEFTLYRIATELINNAVKHSRATTIDVECNVLNQNRMVVICCIDNGIGFDVSTKLSQAKGIGLRSIRSRANSLMGEVYIDSSPGKGTKVTVKIPSF